MKDIFQNMYEKLYRFELWYLIVSVKLLSDIKPGKANESIQNAVKSSS